jgi:hypothetical protein
MTLVPKSVPKWCAAALPVRHGGRRRGRGRTGSAATAERNELAQATVEVGFFYRRFLRGLTPDQKAKVRSVAGLMTVAG